MTIHRYYIGEIKLQDQITIDDVSLVKQWTSVLRYAPNREVRLFNSDKLEALFMIEVILKRSIRLKKVADITPSLPIKESYLCFAMLKKDKNEWVLQKGTELGVSHFLPLITDRTEKTGWNEERAKKIVIEAAEQSGRADVPKVYDPHSIESALSSLPSTVVKLVAEQSPLHTSHLIPQASFAVFIGPEGGWSNAEKEMFKEHNIQRVALSNFTLRAETAAITSVALLMQESAILKTRIKDEW